MSNYWDTVRPTYIENWYSDLCRLSIPQVGIKLSVDSAKRVGLNMVELYELFVRYTNEKSPPNCDDIIAELDNAVSQFPDGAFVRLGSRSPKDSWYGYHHGFRAMNGTDAWKILTGCSERVAEDLVLAIEHDYEPWIWVRMWQNKLRKDNEFRCFMKDRKLVGISQYNYFDGEFDWVTKNHSAIKWAIQQWFPLFAKGSHLDTVIFDVFVRDRKKGESHEWIVKLLEINPFSVDTDPCLFDWRKPEEFNASLRIRMNGEIYES